MCIYRLSLGYYSYLFYWCINKYPTWTSMQSIVALHKNLNRTPTCLRSYMCIHLTA